ncbi:MULTISPECIES: hypothetical protein [unclassified Paraburkholderia]|uniref:hypothetical protein n=1 Tax=unclassified Paraburkholderia TaxID=2615204 RepID=UPI0017DD9C60|nr:MULTISPECIES: hypothetical protein [unclassified Paraburkholderia]MBB5448175.1 hypothetical protein [Paraburkholderia sp. WSM4177]MBB5483675.1 hypothetical protein [Paraburkholderia sp. WSM4180]
MIPDALETALAVTVSPEQVSPALLRQVGTVLAMGDGAHAALQRFAEASGREPPASGGDGAQAATHGPAQLAKGDALLWRVGDAGPQGKGFCRDKEVSASGFDMKRTAYMTSE